VNRLRIYTAWNNRNASTLTHTQHWLTCLYVRTHSQPVAASAFSGLRAIIVTIIANATISFGKFVSVHSLMDSATFMDGIVMEQITPGPVVITATFTGYWLYGLLGGLVVTVSVFLPSFLMVVGIVPYYDRLRKSVYFNRAIAGILPSFIGLLLSVNIRFALSVPWNLYHAFLASAALVALLLKVEIFWVVLIGIVISILIL